MTSSVEPIAEVFPERTLRSRFQAGLIWNLLGAIFNQGSTFVFNIIAANLLGREMFGEYGMVASTLTTLVFVAQLACGYTVTKYVAEYRLVDKEKTGRIVGMLQITVLFAAGTVASGLALGARWLAYSVLKAPELRAGLTIGAAVVFLNVLIGFSMGVLAGFEAYKKLARSLILMGVFYLAVCTLATRAGGLNGAFAGLFLSALFGCILLGSAVRSECHEQHVPLRYGWFGDLKRLLTKFAFPAAASGLTFLPALWFGSATLVRQRDGYVQMALFSASYTLMTAVLFIPNITNVVGWSLLNHHRAPRHAEQYRSTFRMNLMFVGCVVLAGAATLSVVGTHLLNWFGKSFADGYSVLLIMLGAAIPQAVAQTALQHVQSAGYMWTSFFSVILPRDLLIVILAYLLIPKYSAAGFAAAYAVAWTIALIITIQTTLRLRTATGDFAAAQEVGTNV